MAVTGVLRPGYVQLRVLDLEEAILHYRDRIGLNLVSVEGGRAFFQAFDEFDRHSITLCEADTDGLDRMGLQDAKDADIDPFAERRLDRVVHGDDIRAGQAPGVRRKFSVKTPTDSGIDYSSDRKRTETRPRR